MKRIGICGHFGGGELFLDGQTVKTKIIADELVRQFASENVLIRDTYGGAKRLLFHIIGIIGLVHKCENVIILPAQNSLRIFAPLIALLNKFYHRKLHYLVIGGWLPEFVRKRPYLKRSLHEFDCIYVETNTMKNKLEELGFHNIDILRNCKMLDKMHTENLKYVTSPPYQLCTFSRIMKEKGIENAINSVVSINEKYNATIYSLTLYGQVASEYRGQFEKMVNTFPSYIKYGGLVPFDKSVEVLKDFFALLFPTEFYTEGIPGTILDAYAAGLPVICSKWESFDDVVKDGITGIGYDFEKPELLSKILEEVYCCPEKINLLRVNCLKASEEYLPDKAIIPLVRRI